MDWALNSDNNLTAGLRAELLGRGNKSTSREGEAGRDATDRNMTSIESSSPRARTKGNGGSIAAGGALTADVVQALSNAISCLSPQASLPTQSSLTVGLASLSVASPSDMLGLHHCLLPHHRGALFGAGLYIAGMTNPAKIVNFLDIAGTWDPSLIFVMGGGIPVATIGFIMLRRRAAPVIFADS